MSGRYLRAHFYGTDGRELPRPPSLSTAIMPSTKLMGMKVRARDIVGAAHQGRRDAAVNILLEAKTQKFSLLYAVSVVCCPNRRLSAQTRRSQGHRVTLTPTNSYLGSFAVLGDLNQIWCGDAMFESLNELETHLGNCIRQVRVKEDRGNEKFALLV